MSERGTDRERAAGGWMNGRRPGRASPRDLYRADLDRHLWTFAEAATLRSPERREGVAIGLGDWIRMLRVRYGGNHDSLG
jgi:hypothetical protein